MKGRVVAEPEEAFHAYLKRLEEAQSDDGYTPAEKADEVAAAESAAGEGQ